MPENPENPVFVAIHTALTDWLINTHSEEHSNITREQNITSVKQHEAIYEAICEKDADKAETILKEHLLHRLTAT
ncbi:FCD domain-containing protein [Escherichia coli]